MSCDHDFGNTVEKEANMRIIESSVVVEVCPSGDDALRTIERAGRTCYKSEHKITPESAAQFVRMIIDRGHHSVKVLCRQTIADMCPPEVRQ